MRQGDIVIYNNGLYLLTTIVKEITETSVVLDDGTKVSLDCITTPYSEIHTRWGEQLIEERMPLLKKIKSTDFEKISTERLKQIVANIVGEA